MTLGLGHHSSRRRYLSLALGLLVLSFLCLCGCHGKKPTEPAPGIPPDGPIATDATWSPDGSRIAYNRAGHPLEEISSRIQILELATGNITTIDSSISGLDHLDWSPDGRWFAFDYSGSIMKMQTNGDSLTQLTQGPNQYYPNWSPDGSLLAFCVTYGDGAGIYTVTADGSVITPLGILGLFPDWLGTSDSLIATFPFHIGDSACFSVGLFAEGDSAAWPICDCRTYALEECVASPTATAIAFVDLDEWNTLSVFLVTRPVMTPVKISESWCIKPAWSPDGTRIVYSSLMDGALHMYDLRDHTTTRLTPIIRPVDP